MLASLTIGSVASVFMPISVIAATDDKPSTIDFLNIQVVPLTATYLVTRDVNVRRRPETKSKRVGRYRKGEKLTAVGRYKGWVAVRQNGQDQGFVYATILRPVIDGKIDRDVVGKVDDGKRSCVYRLEFDGKSPVDGQLFLTSDYSVVWQCKTKNKKISLFTPMYLIEAFAGGGKITQFQMTLDVPDMDDGLEAVLSTNFFYRPAKFIQENQKSRTSKVVFDGVSMSKFAGKPKPDKRDVNGFSEALKAVIEMSYSSWNDTFWKEIITLSSN